jgi:HlyD family secretion protein
MSALTNPVPSVPPPVKAPTPRVSPAEPRRPRSWLWLVGLLSVAGGAWLFYSMANEQKAQQQAAAKAVIRTTKAYTGSVVRTIRVAGQTTARSFYNITAPILRGPESGSNLILLKLVRSGIFVHKGDLLAQIDGRIAQDHIEDVQDIVEAAQADTSKLSAQQMVAWENLQQTLRVAKSDVDKWRLDAQAAETKTPVDQQLLKLGVEEAEARYRQLQQDVANTKAGQRAQAKVLEYTVDRHKRHLGRHTNDIKKYTITAPIEGLAVVQPMFRGGEMQPIQEGDQVHPGTLFLKVMDTRTMQVEGTINQSESGDFRLGQPAVVGFDAFPDMKFSGKVFSIGALATRGWRENYYIRRIPVRVEINGVDPRLIPDLSAFADVTLDRTDNAVVVPRAALRQDQGKLFVEVKNGDSFERREVVAGVSNEVEAAITSGLSAGDEVRLF